MPRDEQITYSRMKKGVHCVLRCGHALFYGTGSTEERALADARQWRDRFIQQPAANPAPKVPGWHAPTLARV